MSNLTYKNYPLSTLFKSKRGNSKYTKKYCNLNKGEYLVYTGTIEGEFGRIRTYDHEGACLTYTTDGVSAGTCQIIDGKYNIGGHRAILEPLVEGLDIRYFKHILEPMFKNKLKEGNVPSITWNRISELEIPVPLSDNKEFDCNKQTELSKTYDMLLNHRINIKKKVKYLQNAYISLPIHEGKFVTVKLPMIFDFVRGKSCTRDYCNKNKGEYPVYSANNDKPLAHIDSYEYDGKYITLSRNGIAGKIKILDGKFTINEDRFILITKVENIDLEYFKYVIEPILRGRRKGREGHDGQNEFTKLSFSILNTVELNIPIDGEGEFDLEIQKKMAAEYKKIEILKASLCSKIDELISTDIAIK